MKCIICHSEDIHEQEVFEEFKDGNNVIYVPIKTLVCKSCGERYYNKRAMSFLEEIEQKIDEHSLPLKEVGKVMMAE